MMGWYYKHLRGKIFYWEKRCIEAEGRYTYWVEQFTMQKIALDIERERTAKLLRKLSYYRRKLKRQNETTDSKVEP